MSHPLYHRRASSSQTTYDCLDQARSNELWGKGARPSGLPAAKAYLGALPDGVVGVEFVTSISPEPTGHPFQAMWYGVTSGAKVRHVRGVDYVVIPITIIRNTQC